MNKKNIYLIVLVFSVITPIISFAAPLDGLKGLITAFGGILNLLIPVVFGLALLFFFWGMAQFILHSDEEKVREDGKSRMLWGIVALFVIVSIYGIINFIGGTLGINTNLNTNSAHTNGACYNGINPVDGSSCSN